VASIEFAGQVWAATIPAVAALAVVLVNARSGTLRKVERLTEMLSAMRQSSERQLVEDLRDDYLTSWSLQQMAPALMARRTGAIIAYSWAAILFLIWISFAFSTQYDAVTWWWYLATILATFVGVGFHATRFAIRAKWARDERARRWMRRPIHSRLRAQLNEDE
jgi:hypothetical protein